LTSDKVNAHLQVARYGDFLLTEAIRPSLDLQVVPRQGYRRDTYRDPRHRLEVPVLAASVSAEKLFDVFLDLLTPLGDVLDVVVESSHQTADCTHRDLVREHIEHMVLLSHLYDYEDLLLNDGCTGLAVISTEKAMEVQFDEHKLLVMYARDVSPFERILRRAGIERDDTMRLITEAEHLHSTDDRFADALDQFCLRLGIGELVGIGEE
jgi:hypothetical protein